jgi:hypothetical protein
MQRIASWSVVCRKYVYVPTVGSTRQCSDPEKNVLEMKTCRKWIADSTQHRDFARVGTAFAFVRRWGSLMEIEGCWREHMLLVPVYKW